MTTILIKKKDTAGAPASGDLTNAAGGAEIAVNTATKRLYSKDSGGNIIELGTNPSTIDTTTVDTTNLEVTNIKAKDGTASATIANSTGIFTHSTATVFTAGTASTSTTTGAAVITGGLGVSGRINAANFDGIVGANTAAAGSFTTLSATGNVTLGDATTDTVTVNGYMGVGGAANADNLLRVTGSGSFSGANLVGVVAVPTGNSSGTAEVSAFLGGVATAAASYTLANAVVFKANNASKGAGSTITNQHGLYINDQTQGTNNYGVTSLVSSGTNKYNIYASGTAANYFAGNVGIGTTLPVSLLTVEGSLDNSAITGSNTPFGIVVDNASTVANSYSQINLLNGGIPTTTAQNDGWAIRSLYQANNDCDLSFNFLSNSGGTPIGSEKMRIDSSGNVGIGVTPSAWGSGYASQQIGSGIALTSNSATSANILNNAYYNGSNWIYQSTNAASRYSFSSGTHAWFIAPSGTAGTAITFTQAMTLDASG